MKQFVYAVIFVIVLGLISVNMNSVHAIILPPLKQIASGVLPEDVACSDGLVLIKKVSKETVACVKPQTAEKLVERGWGTKTLQSTQITNDNSKTPSSTISLEDKTWVEVHPRQYMSYENRNVTIFDSRFVHPDGNYVTCAACGCPTHTTLYQLVSNSDVDKMLELGYKISTEEVLTRIGQKVNWTFIPADPYSCEGVDCWLIHFDERCRGGEHGYLVGENGSPISNKEKGILESDALIDYSLCHNQ